MKGDFQNAVYLLRTPPRREALRHSGGESLLWTSATVTLYLEVEDRRERRPGTEQKMSVGRQEDRERFSFISKRGVEVLWCEGEGRESWESREALWREDRELSLLTSS